jgi:hypothetical protein
MTGASLTDLDLNDVRKFEASEISLVRYEDLAGRKIDPISAADVAPLRPRVQASIANRRGLSLVKTHNTRRFDSGYPLINSEATAGAVYIVRNPLDVAVSYARHRDYTIDRTIDQMARFGIINPPTEGMVYWVPSTWSDNVESWTAEKNAATLVLRYEDLTERPEEGFGRLAAHLHLRPSPEQVRMAVAAASFANLRRAEQRHGFTERPLAEGQFFREGRTGAWREYLSPEQVARIVSAHGVQMARFGYVP